MIYLEACYEKLNGRPAALGVTVNFHTSLRVNNNLYLNFDFGKPQNCCVDVKQEHKLIILSNLEITLCLVDVH